MTLAVPAQSLPVRDHLTPTAVPYMSSIAVLLPEPETNVCLHMTDVTSGHSASHPSTGDRPSRGTAPGLVPGCRGRAEGQAGIIIPIDPR